MEEHSRRAMRGRTVLLLASTAAILGGALICWASLAAEVMIELTTSPPSPALAGERFALSARSPFAQPIKLTATGACSFTKPPERTVADHPPAISEESSSLLAAPVVYLVRTGACDVGADTDSDDEHFATVQSFEVAADPSAHIRFLSSPSHHPQLNGSYKPTASSTPSIELAFRSSTPSVCEFGHEEPIRFFLAGRCTLAARQAGSSKGEAPEAVQSFRVSGPTGSDAKLATVVIELYYKPFVLPGEADQRPAEKLWLNPETFGLREVGSTIERELTVEDGRITLRLSPGEYRIMKAPKGGLYDVPTLLVFAPRERSVVKLHVINPER